MELEPGNLSPVKTNLQVSFAQVVDCVMGGDFLLLDKPCIDVRCEGQKFLEGQRVVENVIFDYEQASPNSLLVIAEDDGKSAASLLNRKDFDPGVGLIMTSSRRIADLARKQKICSILLADSCDDGVAPARRALRALAKMIRAHTDIPVIGIAGTSGKTTTKDLTITALSARCNVLGTFSNQNSVWAVTRTLLKLNNLHDACVLEFGSRKEGHVRILSKMAQPTIAYISSIGASHLETFGDIQQVYRSETDIFRCVIESDVQPKLFVGNLDDRYVRRFFRSNWRRLESQGSVITISRGSTRGGDVTARRVQLYGSDESFKTRVFAQTPWGDIEYTIPLAGKHNVTNSLAALSLSMLTGKVSLEEIAEAFQEARISKYRSDIFRLQSGVAILNDSYNANPLSMRAAFEMLKQMKNDKENSIDHVIAAVGDMLELGEGASEYHSNAGEYARECGVDELWVTGKFANDWANGFGKKDSLRIFDNTEDLLSAILEAERKGAVDENSCILLKSSHDSGLYRIALKLKKLRRGFL